MPARKSDEEGTPDQPTLDELGITNPNEEAPAGDTRRAIRQSRGTPKTEGHPSMEELRDDRPQVVRERDRMRQIFEERGRKS
jgi:hypothetical protein